MSILVEQQRELMARQAALASLPATTKPKRKSRKASPERDDNGLIQAVEVVDEMEDGTTVKKRKKIKRDEFGRFVAMEDEG